MTVYYSWADRVASSILDDFERRSGIRLERMRRSARAIVKILELEKDRPVASVLIGGPVTSYVMGADAGVFEAYTPPSAADYPPDRRDPQGRWHAIEGGVIGFGTDPGSGLEPPRTWKGLLDPRYRGKVIYGDPTTSGTGYTILIALIGLYGEEGAYEYLQRLDENVAYYPEGGAMAADLARLGVGGVAIAFVHDLVSVTPRVPDKHLTVTVPEEGTGWELGGCALIAGAPHPELAKKLIDFLLGAEAQELPWRKAGVPFYPVHPEATGSPDVPAMESFSLVEHDWSKAGRAWDARARRWYEQIGARRRGEQR